MALNAPHRSSPRNLMAVVYLAVLAVVLVIVAGASVIWMSTDNSGTNFLASDPQSTSPPSETP